MSVRHPGQEDDPAAGFELDAFLPYRINVLARRLSLDLAHVYEGRFGISIPEWRVLAHLSGNAAVSVREIHERVDMDKVKVSRAAARLEEAGYVTKRVNASDRRLVDLALTERGQALFARIVPLALAYEAETLAVLTPAERMAFLAALEKLVTPRPDKADRR